LNIVEDDEEEGGETGKQDEEELTSHLKGCSCLSMNE
jgi:hypothetical protein